MTKQKKILLVGGGTGGSVSPLIAVYQRIKEQAPETKFLFIGGQAGPEQAMVSSYKISFQTVMSGKFRRYFSWHNFIDPFKIIGAFFQSLFLLIKFKPNVIMIAGSFVGVPVAWAAAILRIPVLIHQQDILTGLANKLMANSAKKITVSYEPSLKDFYSGKTILTGNPVRKEFFSCSPEKGKEIFGLKDGLPTVLILGGGTGAVAINDVVRSSLAELLQFCQIIHITGKDKRIDAQAENYHQFEFLTHEMTEALCAADIIVSRAGMSTLSELVILAKATVLVPLPGHQDYNAAYFQKNNAVMSISQANFKKGLFIETLKELIFNKAQKENLERNIAKVMKTDGAEQVAKLVLEITK